MSEESVPPTGLRVCVDVDDVERAVDFYTRGIGLEVGRRFAEEWVELVGGPVPIDLLRRAAGTPSNPTATAAERHYHRHWTPVHLDFAVEDLDAALESAIAAGAVVEGEVRSFSWGRIARLADPFGHGLCLLEFRGRGYDEILDPSSGSPPSDPADGG